MKKLITTLTLLLFFITANCQEKFYGYWTSDGKATDIVVFKNKKNKIQIGSISSTSGKKLETKNIEFSNDILYLENYFEKNNWSTIIVFQYENKNTLTAYLKNNNGIFKVLYRKIKNIKHGI